MPFPAHADDIEFDEYSTTIPNYSYGDRLRDTSVAHMCAEACNVMERLQSLKVQPSGQTWEARHDMARDLGINIRERYLKWLNLELPYDRLRYSVGESMLTNMMLRAVRPMQRHVSSTPPRVDSPYVLQMALDCLAASRMVYSDPAIQRWNWMTWVPWHALSVALAGLCSIRGTPLAEKTWWYAEKQYERCEAVIADSKEGMLWKPIVKLYNKATAFRDAGPKHDNAMPQMQAPSRTLSSTWTMPLRSTHALAMQQQRMAASDTEPLFNSPLDMQNITGTIPSLGYNSVPFDPSMNSRDGLSTDMSALETFPNDASWLDWEQIMNDFADNNGDLMNGLQWSGEKQA